MNIDEVYIRPSKYGSVKIADTDATVIEAHTIRIIADAVIASLIDDGVPLVKQVETVTLTGTSGTATISDAGGLDKVTTFDSDLITTAANFVTSHAAAYFAEDIVVTSSGADIIFTALVAGTEFTSPTIANTTGDLDGTVAVTVSNEVSIVFHGVSGSQSAGEEIYAAGKFINITLTSGTVLVF